MFHLLVVDTPTTPPDLPLFLCLTTERLELRDMTTRMGPVYVDFVGGALGYRRRYGGGRKQPLAKAIGLKDGTTVLDATAGLGRDAFILAHLGCHVQMIERSPVVAALLYNGLQRAEQDAKIGTLIKERLQLIHHDAQDWLLQLSEQPDVIYLDPMYPHRKKSALVKKEMRLFRAIVGDDLDAPALLKVALACARRRVVVKRPKWAPSLEKPSFYIESENTRFDVYNF
ncbi:MAG: class I SAM-dependent methyltransferase [Pseudomonadota bacterium]